ncbi:MAG: hypothetical protein ABJA74_14295 [Lapillicoccus sp.]
MLRAELGARNTLTLDAGDTIQGTPLAYYYARIEPITSGTVHPMATAMSAIGYDAAAIGNHEFNYGLDPLRTLDAQRDHPLLSANTGRLEHRRPALPPVRHQNGPPARAGHDPHRHPRPGDPGRRDLGQGQRRRQGQVPPASSSRSRSSSRG